MIHTTGFRSIILFFALLALPALLRAEEAIEHFLLPETPPSIERLKNAPLDRPMLRKQNFDAAANDITLPPSLLDLTFPVFSEDSFPVRIVLSRGSFARSTGDLFVSSPYGWQTAFRTASTDGEKSNLAREEHLFRWGIDTFAAPGTRVAVSAAAAENKIWRQRHRYYGLTAGGEWYSDNSLSVKTNLAWDRGEVKDDAENDHVAGTVAASYAVRDGHSVSLSFSPEHDTAFAHGSDFASAGARYAFSPAADLAVAAGGRFQDSRWYPQADLAWHAFRLCRVSVSYDPGIEKPDWAGLYMDDKYVKTASSLSFPEKVFSLGEKLSFFAGENDLFEIAFRQVSWRNYIYWRQVTGTDFITPDNLNENYVATMELTARHKGERFSPAVTVRCNSDDDIPLVPAYTLQAGIDYTVGTWTFSGTGMHVDRRSFSFSDARRLAAYTDVGLGVRKSIMSGIELSVAATNLLSRKIELQPGFVREAPDVQAGITVSF